MGGFNKQDPSWKVLDPRSGKEVARLERKDGQWAVAESSVEPSVEPSHKRSVQQPVATHGGAGSGQGQGAQAGGARAGRGGGGGGGGGASGTSRTGAPPSESHSAADRGHMARLVDGAIDWIEGAIAKLHQPWSRALTEEMNKLFGDEALTEEGKARIEQKLEQTLKFLQQSKSSGEGNLHISGENLNPQHPNAPAFTNTVTGDIYFKPDFMRQTSESYLIQTMVHEATHAGAKTVDDWYLYPNEERYPNWDGHQALFNFDTAINTADSLAHAVQAFHKYA
ncbi:MAG TPA: hypothetical protein VME63_17970 [Dyella sp.]|nr:hypothetical protein [Dyella sp.]